MPIFISYSRKDTAFVRRLHEGLAALGRETWVDWEGIPPTADWMRQIESAIDAADAVVCVLSPDFIASEVCAQEVTHAVRQHKRLIPILPREVQAARVAPELGRLNWVDFRGFDATPAFDASLRLLLSGIDTDLDWVRDHTRLLLRATEWDAHGREASLGLRGADLQKAEQWLALGPTKAPPPTELQTRYVIESRRQATRRRSVLVGAGTAALVVIAVAATLAFTQRREAARQEAVALARQWASASERLREQAPVDRSATGPVERAVQLAAEALRQVDAVGEASFEADLAMRRALAVMPIHQARLEAPAAPVYAFDAIAFDPAGRLVAVDANLAATAAWEPGSFKPVAAAGQRGDSARSVSLAADGRFIAAIEPGHAAGVVDVTEFSTGRRVARLAGLGPIGEVALAPGAAFIAVRGDTPAGSEATRLWSLPELRLAATLPSAGFLSFSPDGRYLAGVVGREPTVWAVERLAHGDPAPLALLQASGGLAGPVLFSPDGTHVAVGFGEENGSAARIGVWSTGDWKSVHEVARELLLAIGPGGRMLAVRGDDNGWLTRVVEVATDRELARLHAASEHPPVAFHPNGRDVAIVSGPNVELWRIAAQGAETARIAVGEAALSVAFTPDEAEVAVIAPTSDTGATGLRMQRWRFANGDGARSAAADLDLGRANGPLAFSADGRTLALADGSGLRVLESATGRSRASFTSTRRWTALALSSEGRHLAGTAQDDTLQLFGIEPPASIGSAALGGPVAGGQLAVTAEGQRVVAVTRAKATRIGEALDVRVLAGASLAEVASAPVGRARSGLAAQVCALSADGRLIAVNTAGSALAVREAATGRRIGGVEEAGSPARCAFSADNRLLAVNGAGDTVRVWDLPSQTEVARLEGVAGLVGAGFSPGGRYLATLSDRGSLKIWPLRRADLLAEACRRLSANIGRAEWARAMGERPYQVACAGLPVPE